MTQPQSRRILVMDSAYTYDMLVDRDLSVFVTHRELDGFFEHTWTVHPVGSLFEPESSPRRYGTPVVRVLNERHTYIDGRVGKFSSLRRLPLLNFLFSQIELVVQLVRIVLNERVSVIRAEDPQYNGVLCLIVSRICRVPLVVGVFGNPDEIRANSGRPIMPRVFKWIWLERRVERFVLRRADRVLVQNEDNRSFVLRKGVPWDSTAIFLLGNAVHPSHFIEPSERERPGNIAVGGAPDQYSLLCISRLEPLKLTDHVVRVVACLKARGWNVRALFAGDGRFRAEMTTLAEALDVGDRVVFLGNLDQESLARLIPCVDVVVSPLTGRALAEAALGAAPIVAYDIDWHAELIETGVTGELVPSLQYEAMADSVARILGDRRYGDRLGSNARRRALDMMNPNAIRDAQIRVYDELLRPA